MLHIVLLASFKYILTIPYAKLIGLNYSQALIAVLVGGIGGFLFFYYMSNWAIRKFGYIRPIICKVVPGFIKRKYQFYCENKAQKPKRIFSRKSRTIARIKKSYGLWGIVVTTPVLLTIPVGAFLASKYYSRRRFVVGYMLGSIVIWAVVLTTFIHVFPQIIK
ncbi:MAG: hypothetical protein JXR31_16770 [Prolixibacteraceae bacterium]|nr:hypothetical protein [Prolixibacteraceae bacterium]MBN2775912.1 hypothetical protein [Prolixibacteraceae bacterium]